MDRHYGSGRRRRIIRRSRPIRTAPVPQRPRFYCGDSDDAYGDDYDRHHYRHTEQHYPERYYPDDIDEDIDVFEGYEEYEDFQTEPRRNQVSSHLSHQFYDPYYARQSVGPDPRNTDNYPSDGRDRRNLWQQEYAPGQGHTYRQASSKSDSVGNNHNSHM